MVEDTPESLPTEKQKQLFRIASIANIFVWIVLAVYTLSIFVRLFNTQNSYMMTNMNTSVDFWRMLAQTPLRAASLFIDMLRDFLQGVVLALVLRGISLGLNMIAEIDWNRKEELQGAGNE